METTNRAIALACDQADEVCELTPPSNTEVPAGQRDESDSPSTSPATFTMHCPTGAVNACVLHARAIEGLFQRMWGMRVPATKAPEGSQCDTCLNAVISQTSKEKQ